ELVDAFLTVLEQAGYYAGLYCSTSYLNGYVSESVRKRYTIWVAQYSKQCTYSSDYGIWQHSVAGHPDYDVFGKGSVYGITGQCDLDYAYIDFPKIIKNAGLNGFSGQNSSIENEGPDSSNTDNPDTLEQILQHVASIDKKLQ
ncbi:MAG: GH25 family lysozyme, partial [Ruminococcus sp.]